MILFIGQDDFSVSSFESISCNINTRCPPLWLKYKNKLYLTCNNDKSNNKWTENRKTCVKHRATLPLIESREEQNFLKSVYNVTINVIFMTFI